MSTPSPHFRPTPRSRVLAALAATLLVILAGGCGGDSAESNVGVRELGWELRPLPAVDLVAEFRALGEGSPSFGTQVEQILQAEEIEGVWVSEIRGGSAARASIDPGDVITGVAGQPVNTVEDVRSALRSAERGTKVEIEGVFVASGDPTDFLDAWRAEVEIPVR